MPWTNPVAVSVGELYTATKYNAQVKDDLIHLHETHGPLWVPACEWADGGVLALTERSSGLTAYVGAAYLNGASDTLREATRIVPDNWISGGFTVKVHWTQSATGAGNVRWQFYYLFRSANSSLIAAKTELAVTAAAPAVADQETITTIGTTAAPTAGQIVLMTLRRNAADSLDTLVDNVFMVGLELEYI